MLLHNQLASERLAEEFLEIMLSHSCISSLSTDALLQNPKSSALYSNRINHSMTNISQNKLEKQSKISSTTIN